MWRFSTFDGKIIDKYWKKCSISPIYRVIGLAEKGITMPSAVGFDQDLELFKRAQSGDTEARNALVEANIGLVYQIVNRGRFDPKNKEELESLGVVGLMRAIDSYDPDKSKFSTWAYYWISAIINREYHNLLGGISINQNAHAAYTAVADAYNDLLASGKQATAEEIAKMTHLSERQIATYANRPETTAINESNCGSSHTASDSMLDVEVAVDVSAAINSLGISDIERRIVYMRFGLNGEAPLSAINISKQLHLTPRYVYQVLKESIAMLADSPSLIDYRP